MKISQLPDERPLFGSNIENILTNFEQHQAEMIKREAELKDYLSNNKEEKRNEQICKKAESSLDKLLDRSNSPNPLSQHLDLSFETAIVKICEKNYFS